MCAFMYCYDVCKKSNAIRAYISDPFHSCVIATSKPNASRAASLTDRCCCHAYPGPRRTRPPSTLADKTTFWPIALLKFDLQHWQYNNKSIHTSAPQDTRLVRGGFGGPESLALFRSGVTDFKVISASGAVMFSLPCSFRRLCPIVSFSTSGKPGGPLLGEASISIQSRAFFKRTVPELNVLYTCGHVLSSLAR